MRGSTSVGYDQFETSPEAIEQELRPAVCERRPTDRLKANYSIDGNMDKVRWLKISSIIVENGLHEYEIRGKNEL